MTNESSFETPLQRIELRHLPREGLIIDIGGGGEGLVSRIAGSRVYAVDISLDRIREATIHDPDSQWLLSDGRLLPIQDARFSIATLWFSLGYIREWTSKTQVLSEVARVLEPSGHLSILGAKVTSHKTRFLLRAHLHFPDGSISQMTYGMMGEQNQNIESISNLLRETGFREITSEDNEHWFRIEAKNTG